jgi:Carboxypeptidase regulatory-like domain
MLDRVRIASPCSANWELMAGDEQVRFCAHCSKHVYNLSAMTSRDAEVLLHESDGSLCTRFYRRTDGTILTQDCPVGLRAKAGRLRRRVSLAMSGLLGLVPAFAQSPQAPAAFVQVDPAQQASVQGTVKDPLGAAIPQASVSLMNDKGVAVAQTRTDRMGEYRFTGVAPGTYALRTQVPGFELFTLPHIVIGKETAETRHIVMQIGTVEMGGPMVTAEPALSKVGDKLK